MKSVIAIEQGLPPVSDPDPVLHSICENASPRVLVKVIHG